MSGEAIPLRVCDICGEEDRHFLRDSNVLICFDCWESGLRNAANEADTLKDNPCDCATCGDGRLCNEDRLPDLYRATALLLSTFNKSLELLSPMNPMMRDPSSKGIPHTQWAIDNIVSSIAFLSGRVTQ